MMPPRPTFPDAVTLRAMTAARARGASGWQSHHLLPRALDRHRQISAWLTEIGDTGPVFKERHANMLWLPATEDLAAATGMAMHRGPHPAYNDVVAARLERIRCSASSADDARARIARLQSTLAKALTGTSGPVLTLNRHDPMRLFADYASLDDAIARLFSDQPI